MQRPTKTARRTKPRKSSVPVLLFDLDGTLVDTVYEHVSAWSKALKSAGIVVPEWKIHRRVGMSGTSMLEQLRREHAFPDKLNVHLLEEKHDSEFSKAIPSVHALPGSRELLTFLSEKKIQWAIATTGNKKHTTRLLEKIPITARVPVITGDDVAKAKPSPDVFVLAASRLGVPIADCIVVGDSVWDVLAAARKRALGIGLLSGGYSQEELRDAGAFRVYADPADLLFHIEDLGIQE